ncbi:MAG: hypothetical protein ACOXZ9_05370 [Bacteroidales bacterium]|jgi:hypothetical protein
MKFKHIDNYAKAAPLLAISGILILKYFLVPSDSKTTLYVSAILGFIAMLLLIYTAETQSGEIVENNYSGVGHTKKEDGSCQPEILNPHETRKGIDGVKTPYSPDVFKIRNGIKAIITPEGKVKETTFIGKIANIGYTKKIKI